jgi:hypothetical protein
MALQIRPPEDTLLQLSDGDWILVKKWLNAGENNKVFARMVKTMKTGEPDKDGKAKPDVEYDIEQMGGLSQAVAYLLDWSAKDPEGKPIVIRDKSPREIEEALLALPAEAYKEITEAVDAHTKRMEAERTERKNSPVPGSESNSIGTSAVS